MRDTVQLMLTATCAAETARPLEAALEAALAASQDAAPNTSVADVAVACVVITPPGWSAFTRTTDLDPSADLPGYDTAVCRALVELIQRHDAAALIANDASLAQATGADGCHLDPHIDLDDIYRKTRTLLGSDAIVGIMPATSRHTAMTLAEAGADYIGYGVRSALDDIGLQCVAWWAEIFESPVVAFTDGDIAAGQSAIEQGPPDFLAAPLLVDDKTSHLCELSRLIEVHGQLPIAAKDAK